MTEIMKLVEKFWNPSAAVFDKQTKLFVINHLSHNITSDNQKAVGQLMAKISDVVFLQNNTNTH